MYFILPNAGEQFYLRILLTVICYKRYLSFTYHKGITFSNQIKGATSQKDLHTIDGVLYLTFQQTCLALGLLKDDREWNCYFSDAASI